MSTAPIAQGPVDVHVSPLVTMTLSETLAILNNPYGLRLLMDHADLQYSQAASMLEPGEIEPWPTKRWTALRDKGRKIIAEDHELWDYAIKCAFGFEVANAKVSGAGNEDRTD